LAGNIQDNDISVSQWYLSELLEDVASPLFKKDIKQNENINVLLSEHRESGLEMSWEETDF
jgi:hypothetical protein